MSLVDDILHSGGDILHNGGLCNRYRCSLICRKKWLDEECSSHVIRASVYLTQVGIR